MDGEFYHTKETKNTKVWPLALGTLRRRFFLVRFAVKMIGCGRAILNRLCTFIKCGA
jgi:hypothetical protein